MNFKVVKVISKTTRLEVEFTDEKDLKEAILKATPFLQIHSKCGLCGSEEVSFGARRTKDGEYIYPEQYCYSCRARRSMGEYKSPKGVLFFKKWEEGYKKEGAVDEVSVEE